MKNLRRTCVAAVLTLVFALSAFAGQISCPGAPEPPPSTQSSVVTTILLAVVSLVR